MAFSRGLGVIGLLTVSWLAVVGCSDDDKSTQQDEQGGEAGEAAGGKSSAGSATEGGKAGGGGKGGTAGSTSAGTAGTAGSTSGGAGGGNGPELGGAGGDVPVSGGAGAGAGGDGGAGGEPPIAVVSKQCSTECEEDDDCKVIGALTPLVCDATSKRCVNPLQACETNNGCVPFATEWYRSCDSTADCDEGFEACVAWEGKGYCAVLATEGFCFPGEPTTLGEFGLADAPVDVCVVSSGRCVDAQCIPGCAHPLLGGCESDKKIGFTCNETSGFCECAAGTECNSGVCGADSRCVDCTKAEDCGGALAGLDSCVQGKCGCSNAEVCPDNTASGSPVCE